MCGVPGWIPAGSAQLGDRRTVSQSSIEQLSIRELVTEAFLQRRVGIPHRFLHNSRWPPCLLWRAQLRSTFLLGVVSLRLAGGLHRARHGRTLIESGDGVVEMRGAFVGHPE